MESLWRIKSIVASFSPRKEKDGQSKERKKEDWCLEAGLQSMLMLLGVKGRHVLLVWQETIEVNF